MTNTQTLTHKQDGAPLKRIEDSRMNPLIRRVAAFSLGGMFTDGYILGHVGIALSLATVELGLNALWLGLLAAATLLGILFGAPLAGRLSDRFGRKWLLTIDFALIAVGAVLHLFVADEGTLLVLRFLMGVAIGAEYAIGAALLSEVAPLKHRGALLACLNAMWIVGFVGGFLVAYAMRAAELSWQMIFASAAIPAVLVLLLRLGSPESPRWLVANGRSEEALAIVQKHFGPDFGLGGLESHSAEKVGIARLFAPEFIKRSLFAGIFWACQVVPLFALTIFLPQVFEALGIASELGAEMLVNGMLLVSAALGVYLVARLTRRGFTIWSFIIVALALVVMAFSGSMPVAVGLIAFAVFVLVAGSASNLEYVYPSEIFPTELRATGVGFAAAMSRVGAAASTFLLPIALQSIGTLWTMLILAVVAIVGAAVSAAWAPETKGLTLSEAAATGEKR